MLFKALTIVFLILGYLNIIFFNVLRIKQTKKEVPLKAYEIYNLNNYERSLTYLNKNRKLTIIQATIVYVASLVLLISNYFSGFYNALKANLNGSDFLLNVLLLLPLVIVYLVINNAFAYIKTFKLEDKYGFNKTTLRLFIKDRVVISVITLIVTLLITYIGIEQVASDIDAKGEWLSIVLMVVVALLIYLLRRYLNKLTPIPDGSLKDKIEEAAKKHNFKFKKVYISNASKRTNKVNAYFQGFGFFRKIVLYDTLIEQFSEDEVLAVFLHEIAHAKNRDVIKIMLVFAPPLYFVIFLFDVLHNYQPFFTSFGFNEPSITLTLFAYFALFNFAKILFNLIMNPLTRKAEYRADRFEAENIGKEVAINVLLKLTRKHLSDINPHPIDIFVNYSHPTMLQRINAIENIDK